MVGSIITVLPLGKLYGIYNAKYLYIASLVLFLASSALCGAAPNMASMIVGRVFLGMAGNGMYFGILNLLSVMTTDKERPAYLSLVGFVWGIGTVLGPVIGGAFEKVNWRWAFYVNLIIGGVFSPVYLFLLPSFDPQSGSKGWLSRSRNFDAVGAVLSIGAMISLVMAINFGGTLYAWNSGQIITLFVVAGVLSIFFGLQQAFGWFTTNSNRMFPVRLLQKREPILLFIAAAGCNATGFIPIYWIPTYFQFTRGDSALEAAVRLLPLITFLSACIMLNGHFIGKRGYYQPWYVLGAVLALVGNVLLCRLCFIICGEILTSVTSSNRTIYFKFRDLRLRSSRSRWIRFFHSSWLCNNSNSHRAIRDG